jgi:flagellin-specific chaperone FliS
MQQATTTDAIDGGPTGRPAALVGALRRAVGEACGRLAGDPARRGERLVEAAAVVDRLRAALDWRVGCEQAPRLVALYGFMGAELRSLAREWDAYRGAMVLELVAELAGDAGLNTD